MVTVQDEASRLKAWISAEHALSFKSADYEERGTHGHQSVLPGNVDQEEALAVLRASKVTLVAIAPGLQEIKVGLERMPKNGRLAALPTRTGSGRTISYHPIGQPRIAYPASSVSLKPATALHNGRYPCGSSISIANRMATGTLGCLVRKDGVLYGLTANHVTGASGYNTVTMPIGAPGLQDVVAGNIDPFVIGHHAACEPWTPGTPENVRIADNLDLALFKIADEDRVTSHQGRHYDTPMTVATIADLMSRPHTKLKKVGRTSGLTTGWLFGKATGDIEVRMSDPQFKACVHFHQILAVGNDGETPFATAGDSGSLAVRETPNGLEAVGIIFSTSPRDTTTYLMPMEVVLDRLGATLVGAHHVGTNAKGSGGASNP